MKSFDSKERDCLLPNAESKILKIQRARIESTILANKKNINKMTLK
jgi:hypothetical protein